MLFVNLAEAFSAYATGPVALVAHPSHTHPVLSNPHAGSAIHTSYAFVRAPIDPDVAPFPSNSTRTHCSHSSVMGPQSNSVAPATAIQYFLPTVVSNHTRLASPSPLPSPRPTSFNLEMSAGLLFVYTPKTP